jgi:succinate dehydrogenase / fumarate reductase, cytochrome b subunit
MSETGWTDKRPMSPHVQVWRWHVTMLGSILHRATGVANYLGAIVATGWLLAAATGRTSYEWFTGVTGSTLGLVVMFGFTVSFAYHLLNGVRHLFLDSGVGLNPRSASLSAWLVLVGAVFGAIALFGLAGLIPGAALGRS